MKKPLWIMLVALVAASGAWAQGTVTQGSLEFTFNANIAGPTAGNANLLWNGVDQLFQLWFWYRCAGDPFETPFPVPDAQSYDQALGLVTLDWFGICGETVRSLVGIRDCSTPGPFCSAVGQYGILEAGVRTVSTDRNGGQTGGPALETAFVYFDFDVAGTAGSDSAAAVNISGADLMHIVDGGTTIDH